MQAILKPVLDLLAIPIDLLHVGFRFFEQQFEGEDGKVKPSFLEVGDSTPRLRYHVLPFSILLLVELVEGAFLLLALLDCDHALGPSPHYFLR
jgi:hypothetical protein